MSVEEWIEILKTIGVPTVVCGASFYYIFKKDIWSQKEREAFQKQDAENDDRIFLLAEHSNQALNNMSKSMDANTAALDQFRHLLVKNNGGR